MKWARTELWLAHTERQKTDNGYTARTNQWTNIINQLNPRIYRRTWILDDYNDYNARNHQLKNYMKNDKSTETVLISLTQALKFLDMLEGHKSVRGLPSESQVYLSGIRAAVTIATEELTE